MRPMAYYPHAQMSQPLENFVVRFAGAPEAIVPQVRQAIKQVNRNLPVDEVVSLSEFIGRSLTQQRLVAQLASFFGLLALLLACVGLYGVTSYDVARRTNELGIRLALGAQKADLLKLILRHGMGLVIIGIGSGLVAAMSLSSLVSNQLYGVPANDPLTLCGMVLLLVSVAFLACWIPARRATQVDRLVALRQE